MSMTSGGKGTQPFSSKMKAMGRGMAKATQQASSPQVPCNYKPGVGGKGYGGGMVRGTGGQTSGKKWVGVR